MYCNDTFATCFIHWWGSRTYSVVFFYTNMSSKITTDHFLYWEVQKWANNLISHYETVCYSECLICSYDLLYIWSNNTNLLFIITIPLLALFVVSHTHSDSPICHVNLQTMVSGVNILIGNTVMWLVAKEQSIEQGSVDQTLTITPMANIVNPHVMEMTLRNKNAMLDAANVRAILGSHLWSDAYYVTSEHTSSLILLS